MIKAKGDSKGRKAGYYYSLVSRLAEYLEQDRLDRKLTRTGVRLICQGIREHDIFTDPYGSVRVAQESIFVDILMERRGDLNRSAVKEFVREYGTVTKRKRPRSKS